MKFQIYHNYFFNKHIARTDILQYNYQSSSKFNEYLNEIDDDYDYL